MEYKCIVCGKIHKKTEEILYCPVCEDYLCGECVHFHNKSHIPEYEEVIK